MQPKCDIHLKTTTILLDKALTMSNSTTVSAKYILHEVFYRDELSLK